VKYRPFAARVTSFTSAMVPLYSRLDADMNFIHSMSQTMFELPNILVLSEIWRPKNCEKTLTAFGQVL
jgi:hypothetical protein